MISIREKAYIFLDGFQNLEYKHKRNIINLYNGCLEEIFENTYLAENYFKKNLSNSASNTFINAIKGNFLDNIIEKYEKEKITVITEESSGYPIRLKEIPFNPICLYAKGNIKLLNSKNTFSIVGSRKTLKEYLGYAKDYAEKLSLQNVTLITGVALGVDQNAILGAKPENTVLVLAGGFNCEKVETNYSLIKKCYENGGLVITEYSYDIPIRNYHYPIRNRIIAGLSDGVLIVSGEFGSGARYTANYAVEYGKEVFAFPYSPFISSGELPNKLIKDGAYLTTEFLDISGVMRYENIEKQIELTEEESKIYKLIESGISTVDGIIENSCYKIYEVMPILTMLEIKGVISNNDSGEYYKK